MDKRRKGLLPYLIRNSYPICRLLFQTRKTLWVICIIPFLVFGDKELVMTYGGILSGVPNSFSNETSTDTGDDHQASSIFDGVRI